MNNETVSDNAILRRRTGAKYVCDVPVGSKMTVFESRVIITHPDHEPLVIENGSVKKITF